MSSTEWTLWHLTPRGWESGTTRLDNGREYPHAPPMDRILTYQYTEYFYEEYTGGFMGSPASSDGTTERWRSDDDSAVEQLLKQHGPCPKKIDTSRALK